jgi:FkbM family methyltransferase
METKCVFGDKLCFKTDSDLERYRVESIFDKEPETIAWIESWKDQEAIFFDVGANIGIYSLYAAHVAPLTKVYSFEAVFSNFSALKQNIEVNDFSNVFPFNIALSSKYSLTDLFLSDLRVGNSGAQIDKPVNEKNEVYEPKNVEKVLSFPIDQLISTFNFPVPNFLKLDVDGNEPHILKGMDNTLRDVRLKSLLIEFNNQDEFDFWNQKFSDCGLTIDHSFDDVPNHSSIRRIQKGTVARNYIFSRK